MAQRENLSMLSEDKAVEDFDDHNLHITDHTRALLTEDFSNKLKAKQRIVKHLKSHRAFILGETVKVAE